ncbi:MAG: hypothetical protein IKB11_02855 [Bacteroidaceae bacterium]|nr:hypothetical protein [Bacteroidaceae bacterium]
MNIWEAFCNSSYYNIYFDLLVAKGVKRKNAINLKEFYCGCLQRIKETRFSLDLKAINKKEVFADKLREIFEVKWKDHFKHDELVPHFYEYLKFLDSIQCLYNDFICEEEKSRLTNIEITDSLTEYELEYMVDGKLVAIMNPTLIYMLRECIVERKITPKKVTIICKNFYGDLINMSTSEYKSLINKLWNPSRKVKKGKHSTNIRIVFPDGSYEQSSTLDALKKIVLFYGFDNVLNKHLPMRKEQLITKYAGIGKEKIYEKIEDGKYILNIGNAIDRLKMANTINAMFGKKLNIEIV